MRSRNLVILSVVVVAMVTALFGTVAYGVYTGLNAGHRTSTVGTVVSGTAARAALGLATDSAPAGSAGSAGSAAIAQPAPGYFPGGPPFGDGGVSADGISAWGVAFREVTDPKAEPDATLIKAAYQDAEKRVTDLTSATGVKAGKLVAMSDHTSNQPYFRPCIESSGPPLGKPVPGAGTAQPGATGSGSAPNGTTVAPAPPQVLPCQANGSNYLVVWVYVRHAIS